MLTEIPEQLQKLPALLQGRAAMPVENPGRELVQCVVQVGGPALDEALRRASRSAGSSCTAARSSPTALRRFCGSATSFVFTR